MICAKTHDMRIEEKASICRWNTDFDIVATLQRWDMFPLHVGVGGSTRRLGYFTFQSSQPQPSISHPSVNDWTPLSQTIDYIMKYSRSESQTQAHCAWLARIRSYHGWKFWWIGWTTCCESGERKCLLIALAEEVSGDLSATCTIPS